MSLMPVKWFYTEAVPKDLPEVVRVLRTCYHFNLWPMSVVLNCRNWVASRRVGVGSCSQSQLLYEYAGFCGKISGRCKVTNLGTPTQECGRRI